MIVPERTRFILDGKIIKEVTNVVIKFNYGDRPKVIISGLFPDIHATLLSVDTVREPDHYRTTEGVDWTQFICEKVE